MRKRRVIDFIFPDYYYPDMAKIETGVIYVKEDDCLVVRWEGVRSEGQYQDSAIWKLENRGTVGVVIDDFSYTAEKPHPLLERLATLDVGNPDIDVRQIVSNCLERSIENTEAERISPSLSGV